MSQTIDINGKKVNLAKVLPLKVGDWMALAKEVNIDPLRVDFNNLSFVELVTLVAYVAKKANPEVTDDDINTLDLPSLISVLNTAAQSGTQVSRPT